MALNANMSDKYGVEDTLDERQWAKLAPMLGQPFFVNGQSDLTCSAVNGVFATSIAAGRACCYGFGADFKAQQVTHPVVTSGTRYDLVAMRFDWTLDEASGGGNAYPVVIAGGATKDIPSARQKTPGVTYDMPLALAEVTYDSVAKISKVVRYIDLRRFPSPIFSKAIETVPPEDRIDGLQVTYGGVTSYWRSDRQKWVTPRVDIVRDSITPYSLAQTVKNPHSGWLIAQMVVPDPGFAYSLILTGQAEIESTSRVQMSMSYSNSTAATSWTTLSPQFLQAPSTLQTSTFSTQFVKNRVGPTVVNVLAMIPATDPAKSPAFRTTQYNGFVQAMVVPL